jgi:hypothetical protein
MKHHRRDVWRPGFAPDRRRRTSRCSLSAALALTVGLVVLVAGCGGSGQSSVGEGAGGQGIAKSAAGHGRHARGAGVTAETYARSGVVGGALFGGTTLLTPEEGALGRRLAIVRVYRRIGQSFPGPTDSQLMAGGRTLLVSLDTVPGQGPSYASIIAGREDAAIRSFLKAVDHAAVRYHLGAIYVSFEHEADNVRHLALGSPSEFIQAWDHIHQLAASAHLDWNQGGRLHWVWILEQTAFGPGPLPPWDQAGGASAYWPGASEVDIVAADGYNSGLCKSPGQSIPRATRAVDPASLFAPVVTFAQAHGRLPVFIAEWGSTSYAMPAVQPNFIHMMQAYVSATPEIAAVLYWDGGQGGRCGYGVNDHPASVAALAAMGQSVELQGHVRP